MTPEDNPRDEVEITKEEWQAGEIARLEGELREAVADLAEGWEARCDELEQRAEAAEQKLAEVRAAADGLAKAVEEFRDKARYTMGESSGLWEKIVEPALACFIDRREHFR